MRRRFILGAALVSALGVGISNARAAMTLTAAGTADGFALSTFVDSFTNGGNIGPIGIAFNSSGQAIIGDYNTGNMYVFNDFDGQHATIAASGNDGTQIAGLVNLGGILYGAQQGTGQLLALNANGTINHVVRSGLTGITGLVADPLTGHLYASMSGQIIEIDPVANTVTTFEAVGADGLTLSADGSKLYAEVGGTQIIGYSTATKAQVYASGTIAGTPDGTALGTGALAGDLFVNTNGGTLVEINLSTNVQTVVATGGSRGDFVVVDPNNDSLLLTQTDRVLRLTAPNGSGFEGAAPLPSTALGGLGLFGALGLVQVLRRKRATA
jgi:hypothetical protein